MALVITLHPERDMNVCTKFHSNPSDSCRGISVWKKVMDRLTNHAASWLKRIIKGVYATLYRLNICNIWLYLLYCSVICNCKCGNCGSSWIPLCTKSLLTTGLQKRKFNLKWDVIPPLQHIYVWLLKDPLQTCCTTYKILILINKLRLMCFYSKKFN